MASTSTTEDNNVIGQRPLSRWQQTVLDRGLARAVWRGDADGVVEALAAGADVLCPRYDLPLSCVSIKRMDILKILLAAGADISTSALLRAAVDGHNRDMFDSLLELGAPVDAANGRGETALHAAAQTDDVYFLDRLLTAGANASVVDVSGGTPLLNVIENDTIDAATRLQWLRKLLGAGADANAFGDLFSSPLRHAAAYGHADIVRELVNAGADANAIKNSNGTALRLAVTSGYTDIVQILLAAGAMVYDTDIAAAADEELQRRLHIIQNSKLARFEPPSLRELSAALSRKRALVSSLSKEEREAVLPQELIEAVAAARQRNRVTTQEWRDFVEETFAS